MQSTGRRDHRDLILWQKALALAATVYHNTRSFPREELYGMTAQLRRAAASVPSNIAEGAGRRTTRDFIAFLHVARGSLAELETQYLLSRQLGLLSADVDWQSDIDEVGRLLNAVISGLKRRRVNV